MAGASLLEIGLETGRTHQIRVHCAAMGHPVLGDVVYGSPSRDRQVLDTIVRRQMLHAWRLQLIHPTTGIKLALEAPLPDDMLALLAQLAPGEQV